MKVIYEFGGEDTAERKVFDAAPEMQSTLVEIHNLIRGCLKYESGEPEDVLEEIRDLIYESGAMDI